MVSKIQTENKRVTIILLLFGAVVGLILGRLILRNLFGAFLLAGGSVVIVRICSKKYKTFWHFLIFILFGYLFLGRSFAYFGFSPIFPGELGLALGGITTITYFFQGRKVRLTRGLRPTVILLIVFILWNAARTLPFVKIYGINSLRDGVIWGYGFYSLFVFYCIPREAIKKFFEIYSRAIPYYLFWLFFAFILTKIFHIQIIIPGMKLPLIHLGSGKVGFQLAGIGSFILLRLDRQFGGWRNLTVWVMWLLWGIAFLAFGASSRGASVAALLGVLATIFFRIKSRWDRPVIVAFMLIIILAFGAIQLTYVSGATELSLEQHARNFESLSSISEEKDDELEGTKEWRLNWWKTIYDETVLGPYFYGGRGYGVNLGIVHGIHDNPTGTRWPHNIFFTFLSRSGVPGLIIWVLLLVAFLSFLAQKAISRRNTLLDRNIAVWVIAYFIGTLFHASTVGLIEGPVGGIWFWSVMGMGLAYFSSNEEESELNLSSQN